MLLSSQKNIDSLLAALAGAFIIMLFAGHGGIGISPDSVVYLSTANNILEQGKLIDFTQNPTVDFPAFYPFFLSCISWFTGLKTAAFAPFLNAFLFGLTIYISGCIMNLLPAMNKWCKWALLSCLVFSPCLLEVYAMLWSETLFILLVLLFIIYMHGYFKSHSRKLLVAAAVIASIAAITRYAGIVIIGTGGLLLLLDMGQCIRRKLIDMIIYALISPLPLAINLVRNHVVGGTLTGHRQASMSSLTNNLHDTGTAFYGWLPFVDANSVGAKWVAILIVLLLVLLRLVYFLRNRNLSNYPFIAASFSLFYLLFMLTMATISRFEGLNSRFFSPVFIPLLLIAGSQLSSLCKKARTSKLQWLAIVFCAMFFLGFQYKQLGADYETWDGVKDAGIPGYAEDSWKQSQTVQYVQQNIGSFKKGYSVYSYSNDAVYFFTGKAGKFIPHKESTPELKPFMNDRNFYLILFHDGENMDLLGMDSIMKWKKLQLLKQFEDGAVYITNN